MATITEFETLVFKDVRCCTCDCRFFMPQTMYDRLLDNGNEFFCPVGHRQWFTDSRQKRLEQAEERLRVAKMQLECERQQRIAAESHRDRLQKRVASGVCPCCKRSFNNLKRHMATKHKDFPRK